MPIPIPQLRVRWKGSLSALQFRDTGVLLALQNSNNHTVTVTDLALGGTGTEPPAIAEDRPLFWRLFARLSEALQRQYGQPVQRGWGLSWVL